VSGCRTCAASIGPLPDDRYTDRPRPCGYGRRDPPGGHVMGNARRHPNDSPSATGPVEVDETSAEEALESMITNLALSNALAMPDAERDALFEHILSGEGVTLARAGDWVE